MFWKKRPRRKSRFQSISKSRRRNQKTGSTGLIAAGSLAVCTVTAGVFFAVNKTANALKINPENYCYEAQSYEETAFLIDYSVTAFASPSQIRDLDTALIDRGLLELGPNEKLSIFVTARDSFSSVVKPVFEICRPPLNPAEQEAINGPEKSRAQLAFIHEGATDKAYEEIAKLISESKNDEKVAEFSPILEQIQGISRYYNDKSDARLKRLFIYSDGIQTSDRLQFCQTKNHLPAFDVFKTRRDYQRLKPAPSLSQIDIKFLLVNWLRLPSVGLEYCTNNEIYTFWEQFLLEQGADVEIHELEYVAPETTQIENGVEKPYQCSRCHNDMALLLVADQTADIRQG